MICRLILLMESQQAMTYHFIISKSRRLCLQSRQVTSFQERDKNWDEENYVYHCFANRKLLITEYLPKDQRYNQDDFILDIIPELERQK
jgi:hypothetical protein